MKFSYYVIAQLLFCYVLVVSAAYLIMMNPSSEIDQNSADIMDEIKNCKDFALERKRTLEEEKEHFQRAAYAVINMLNKQEIS